MGNPPINVRNVRMRDVNVYGNTPQGNQPPQQPPERRFLPILAGIGGAALGGLAGYLGGEVAAGIIRSTGLYNIAALTPYVGTVFGLAWGGTACYTHVHRNLNP